MRSNEHMSKVLAEAEAKVPFGKGELAALMVNFYSKPVYVVKLVGLRG